MRLAVRTTTGITAAVAAAALTVAIAPQGHADPAPTAPLAASTQTFAVPNLDQGVVERYNEFVKLGQDGRFVAHIPSDRFFTDAKGAWAAVNAVTRANFMIDKQRMALIAHGASLQEAMGQTAVDNGTTSKVLPMGQHATFMASWWGMTFTLDAVAAKQLEDGLTKTQDASKLLGILAAIGVAVAPEVSVAVGAVLAALAVANAALKANTTQDGVVIKALWIPVPWTEKPKGPFVPAPSNGQVAVSGGAVQMG